MWYVRLTLSMIHVYWLKSVCIIIYSFATGPICVSQVFVLTIFNHPENLGRADTYTHVNAYGKCQKYLSVLGWHSNTASVPSRSIPNLAFFKARIDVFAYD